MEMAGRENVNGARQSLNALPGGSDRVMTRESCCPMALVQERAISHEGQVPAGR